MSRKRPEIALLLISKAVACLEAGMYGNFNQAEPVQAAKKHYPRASIGFGPQKEHAGRLIYNAIMKGELAVFVLTDSTESEVCETLLQVPLDVLRQMIKTRDGLPDRAIAPLRTVTKGSVTTELLGSLSKSPLYLQHDKFEVWYEQTKNKRNWPSQRSSKKSRIGRPSKRTEELRRRIIGLVNDGEWLAQRNSIADLRRLLAPKGETPSRQTLARLIKQLYRETGDRRYMQVTER